MLQSTFMKVSDNRDRLGSYKILVVTYIKTVGLNSRINVILKCIYNEISSK